MVSAARWLLVLSILVLCPMSVLAQAPAQERVFVARMQVTGQLEDYQVEELQRRLTAGVSRGFAIAAASPTSSCTTARCHAEALKADFMLVTELEVEGRDYRVRLRLTDLGMGQALASGEELCELCGLAEVGTLLEHQAAALHEGLTSARLSAPFLRVRSQPAGATVRIDGVLVGISPVERTVEPGPHNVELALDGYVKQTRRIDSVAGLRESIEIRLSKMPRYDKTARRMRGFAWAHMGLGALALAGGVTLLGLDERPNRSLCSGADVDADGDCRYRFATKEAGLGLSLVAAAPVIVGTILFVVVRARRSRSLKTARGVRPRVTGSGVGLNF